MLCLGQVVPWDLEKYASHSAKTVFSRLFPPPTFPHPECHSSFSYPLLSLFCTIFALPPSINTHWHDSSYTFCLSDSAENSCPNSVYARHISIRRLPWQFVKQSGGGDQKGGPALSSGLGHGCIKVDLWLCFGHQSCMWSPSLHSGMWCMWSGKCGPALG